jgi:DNA (cytosine-5)-methyltransferase 1
MRSAELFAGCGGLALGLSRAGFHHILMAELNSNAVATVMHNKELDVDYVNEWPIALQDVRDIRWGGLKRSVDLISGGPPCQPFGIGGKKRGEEDQRDMWPEAIRAVREARPKTFLFENVRNLAGPKFRIYLDWIVGHLEQPTIIRLPEEAHTAHLERLACLSSSRDYRVAWQVVNAADYGSSWCRTVHDGRNTLSRSAFVGSICDRSILGQAWLVSQA